MTKPDHDIDHFFAEQFEIRGGSRAAATSKIEYFVIIVNGRKPLTIIPKHSILDVAAELEVSLFKSSRKCKAQVVPFQKYIKYPKEGKNRNGIVSKPQE